MPPPPPQAGRPLRAPFPESHPSVASLDVHPVKTQSSLPLCPLAPHWDCPSSHTPCFQNQLGQGDFSMPPKTQSEAGGLRGVGGTYTELCIFN